MLNTCISKARSRIYRSAALRISTIHQCWLSSPFQFTSSIVVDGLLDLVRNFSFYGMWSASSTLVRRSNFSSGIVPGIQYSKIFAYFESSTKIGGFLSVVRRYQLKIFRLLFTCCSEMIIEPAFVKVLSEPLSIHVLQSHAGF